MARIYEGFRRENRIGAANRGWSNKGCLSDRFLNGNPLRQNALWNEKESYDLLDFFTAGVTLQKLAQLHQRKASSVETHLKFESRCLRKAEAYLKTI